MRQMLLCVKYTAKPKMREKFVKEVSDSGILKKIREEEGCVDYGYFFSEEENVLLLIERWKSEEYQKRHLEKPHMKTLGEIKNLYIEKTAVEKYFTADSE